MPPDVSAFFKKLMALRAAFLEFLYFRSVLLLLSRLRLREFVLVSAYKDDDYNTIRRMQGLNRHFAIAIVYATLIPGTAWTAMPGGIRSGLQSASQTGGGSNRPNVTVIVDGDVRHKTLEWFGQAEPSVLAYHIPETLCDSLRAIGIDKAYRKVGITFRARVIQIHNEFLYANASAYFGESSIWDLTSHKLRFKNSDLYGDSDEDGKRNTVALVLINNATTPKSVSIKLTTLSVAGNRTGELCCNWLREAACGIYAFLGWQRDPSASKRHLDRREALA